MTGNNYIPPFNDNGKIKFTPEGGLAIKLTNGIGSATVKGMLVAAKVGAADTFNLQTDEFDTIGVVYDTGIPDGGQAWVVFSGKADVLLKDNVSCTAGDWVGADAVDGRAYQTSVAAVGAAAATVHFKEIGHSIQNVASGTAKTCRVCLHFN